MITDHYKVLGVDRNASTEQIKSAYRELAKKWHPDRNSSPDASSKFIQINIANETLSDQLKRFKYDSELRDAESREKKKKADSEQYTYSYWSAEEPEKDRQKKSTEKSTKSSSRSERKEQSNETYESTSRYVPGSDVGVRSTRHMSDFIMNKGEIKDFNVRANKIFEEIVTKTVGYYTRNSIPKAETWEKKILPLMKISIYKKYAGSWICKNERDGKFVRLSVVGNPGTIGKEGNTGFDGDLSQYL